MDGMWLRKWLTFFSKLDYYRCSLQLPDKRTDKFEHRELLHNLVGGFIRTFRFDVQEQDEKVAQVTAPDRIHREGYCCRVCSQGYQGKEESL